MPRTTISRAPWRFTSMALTDGSPTYDFRVDVPNNHGWQRDIVSRVAEDPCGGSSTIIERSDGLRPLRKTSISFRLRGSNNYGGLLDQLRNAIFAVGPYQCAMPRETLWMQFDPSSWNEDDQGNVWVVTVGAREIRDPTLPPEVLPIIPPGGGPIGIVTKGSILTPAMANPVGTVPVNWANFAQPAVSDFIGLFGLNVTEFTIANAIQYVSTGGVESGTTDLSVFQDIDEFDQGGGIVIGSYGLGPFLTGPMKLTLSAYGITRLYPRTTTGTTSVASGAPLSADWYDNGATTSVEAFGLYTEAAFASGGTSAVEVAVSGSSGTASLIAAIPAGQYRAVLRLANDSLVAYPYLVTVS